MYHSDHLRVEDPTFTKNSGVNLRVSQRAMEKIMFGITRRVEKVMLGITRRTLITNKTIRQGSNSAKVWQITFLELQMLNGPRGVFNENQGYNKKFEQTSNWIGILRDCSRTKTKIIIF